MNSLETPSTETEQPKTEQRDVQTASPSPAVDPVSQPIAPAENESRAEQPESTKVFEMAAIPLTPSELAYACLLIPRFSDHYLTGDISKDLANWVKEVCISFGWRLDAITVRPGYIQWIMTVPMTTNPARAMKVMCQQTSQKIFEDYPRFKKKNLSIDFWAPGFSMVPGNAPQTLEEINNFILQIRRQQGIS